MKPGIYFIKVDREGNKVIMKQNTDASWPELNRAYEQFLRACGYVFHSLANIELSEPQENENE